MSARRALGPYCAVCRRARASILTRYRHSNSWGTRSHPVFHYGWQHQCAPCFEQWTRAYASDPNFVWRRSMLLVLAELGDEVWISLEIAFLTLAGGVTNVRF